jgi:hypothetical protein
MGQRTPGNKRGVQACVLATMEEDAAAEAAASGCVLVVRDGADLDLAALLPSCAPASCASICVCAVPLHASPSPPIQLLRLQPPM